MKSLLKLTDYRAVAEVNGILRNVGFSAKKGRLWVEVEDVGEALLLLDKLSSGPGTAIQNLLSEREKRILGTALPDAGRRGKPLRMVGGARTEEPRAEEPVPSEPAAVLASQFVEEAPQAAAEALATQGPAEDFEAAEDDSDSLWGTQSEESQVYEGASTVVASMPAPSTDTVQSSPAQEPDSSKAAPEAPKATTLPEAQKVVPKATEAPKKRSGKTTTVQSDIQEIIPTKLTMSQFVPGEAPPLPPPELGPSGLPVAVENARRMADVLNYYLGRGMTDPNQLAEECEKLKSRVACLSRVHDFPKQVAQTLKAMGVVPFEA